MTVRKRKRRFMFCSQNSHDGGVLRPEANFRPPAKRSFQVNLPPNPADSTKRLKEQMQLLL